MYKQENYTGKHKIHFFTYLFLEHSGLAYPFWSLQTNKKKFVLCVCVANIDYCYKKD